MHLWVDKKAAFDLVYTNYFTYCHFEMFHVKTCHLVYFLPDQTKNWLMQKQLQMFYSEKRQIILTRNGSNMLISHHHRISDL